ncbi:hypothetical protein [Thalassomonas haliotis]|uniref:Uncharacterized protein n=1 Tax=Thalassomonas haliotis TaxID=485448 RepID=A0ABY7VCK4_9GAMM|nr:hypothetical protein [Thalassomonas haliotis]WDE10632.1 hypothetical protein H3N35_20585 [Thalassomonas haliotis]
MSRNLRLLPVCGDPALLALLALFQSRKQRKPQRINQAVTTVLKNAGIANAYQRCVDLEHWLRRRMAYWPPRPEQANDFTAFSAFEKRTGKGY